MNVQRSRPWRNRAPRPTLIAAFALGAGLGASSAQAETRERVDVSLSGGASANPYLSSGGDTTSGSASLSIDPSLIIQDEVGSIALDGRFRLDQYTSRYGRDEVLRLGASGQRRLSERMSLSGSARVSSARSGARDFLDVRSGELPLRPPESGAGTPIIPEGAIFPEVALPDITGAGRGARIKNYSASAGLNQVLSAVDTIRLGVSGGLTDTDSLGGRDYSQLGLNFNFGRRLSETTSVSASLQGGSANYAGQSVGDGSYVSPLVGINRQLGANTSFSAQVGATFTRLRVGPNDHRDQVDWALSSSLCRQVLRTSLCASGSRNSQPTAFGGLSTVTMLAGTYTVQTGLQDSLTFAGRYSQSSQIQEDLFASRSNFVVFGASARYSRGLGRRLSAFASSSVTRTESSNLLGSGTNGQFEVGIRHRFGEL